MIGEKNFKSLLENYGRAGPSDRLNDSTKYQSLIKENSNIIKKVYSSNSFSSQGLFTHNLIYDNDEKRTKQFVVKRTIHPFLK